MKKTPNLVDAMQRSAGRGRKRMATVENPDPSSTGRATKSNVTGYFSLEVKDQLRHIAADKRCTIQFVLAEALNDLFAKYSKPEIAYSDS